jgi:YVTN family beta-propeller protein
MPFGLSVPKNALRLKSVAIILLPLICLSCGDQYRPVANPVTPSPPNPGFSHVAVVVAGNTVNGIPNRGTSTTVDVSGDTAVSQATVGLAPSFAALVANGTRVYVTNSLDNTVSEFAPSASTPISTISLPSGSAPSFAGTAETLNLYVTNSGNGTVSVISATSNAVTNTVSVGTNPVALVETPVTSTSPPQQVYVANQGSGSVSVISTIDHTASTIAGFTSPVWMAARSDANRVYVLDAGGSTVFAIDTATNTVLPTTASVGPAGANFMAYDPLQNRLYVTNPVGNLLSIINVSNDALTTTTVSVPSPVSVGILPDASRAYVASAAVNGTNVSSAVTVVNAQNVSIEKTIPLGTVPRTCANPRFELSVAASADGSRIYVGNCDVGNTAIIQTSSDTVIRFLAAPTNSAPASTLSITAATQSGSTTTYTYGLTSGPALAPGMNVAVENMQTTGDNGGFTITSVGTGTFTVINPSGVTSSGDSGLGTATTPQNPVFVVAGP